MDHRYFRVVYTLKMATTPSDKIRGNLVIIVVISINILVLFLFCFFTAQSSGYSFSLITVKQNWEFTTGFTASESSVLLEVVDM